MYNKHIINSLLLPKHCAKAGVLEWYEYLSQEIGYHQSQVPKIVSKWFCYN